ncbi:MAG: dienelactone hydrolase family protein [Candidatus Sulfotelmatobacter sp.]
MKKINASILGLFGALDQGIPPDVHKFEQTLKRLGKKVDIKIYDGARYAFENPQLKDGYHAADARKRTVDFMAITLKK